MWLEAGDGHVQNEYACQCNGAKEWGELQHNKNKICWIKIQWSGDLFSFSETLTVVISKWLFCRAH